MSTSFSKPTAAKAEAFGSAVTECVGPCIYTLPHYEGSIPHDYLEPYIRYGENKGYIWRIRYQGAEEALSHGIICEQHHYQAFLWSLNSLSEIPKGQV